ncbi:MAG: M48 family metallopeptidase [Spirochaetales bacterium]|nr:M48 family metallopeptidase [Spirochaetales bacterium]
MEATTIVFVFLGFFIAENVWETLLLILHLRYISSHKDDIPAFVDQEEGREKMHKSVDYSITRGRFSLVASVFSAALLLVIVFAKLLGMLDVWLAGFSLGMYLHGLVFLGIVSFAFSLFSLPFSIYSQFVIEKHFGFNTMTPLLFVFDRLKGLVLGLLLGVPLLLGLFWFMETTGSFWWLFAAGFVVVFQLVVSVLYPTVIAPLFNKFQPLPEGELKEKIQQLLIKLKYRTAGIFIMDGSKRSKHSNAYFTGFGKTKRIVLFDTLVDTLSPEEITAVFAHELGHEKKGHIIKGFLVSIVATIVSFFVLSLLLGWTPLYKAFGFEAVSYPYHALIALVSLFAGSFTFFLKPLGSIFSRRNEYQADCFARDVMDNNPKPLVSALLKLSKDNLGLINPHPLYSFFHYSHPTLRERIAALEKKG